MKSPQLTSYLRTNDWMCPPWNWERGKDVGSHQVFSRCPRGPSHPGEALQSAYRKYTDYKGSKTAFIPIWHDYTHRKIEGIYQRQKKKKRIRKKERKKLNQ